MELLHFYKIPHHPNFTMTSLKVACNDYKISADKCKSEFKHDKIKSWNDVEFYRNEVLPYLELDLISIKYKIF